MGSRPCRRTLEKPRVWGMRGSADLCAARTTGFPGENSPLAAPDPGPRLGGAARTPPAEPAESQWRRASPSPREPRLCRFPGRADRKGRGLALSPEHTPHRGDQAEINGRLARLGRARPRPLCATSRCGPEGPRSYAVLIAARTCDGSTTPMGLRGKAWPARVSQSACKPTRTAIG